MKMTQQEAFEYINNNPEVFLTQVKKGFLCPLCGQGKTKGQGIVKNPKTGKYHCFGCKENGDIIHFIGKAKGFSGCDKESFDEAYKLYDIDIINDGDKISRAEALSCVKKTEPIEREELDFTEYYNKISKHREETKYLIGRGISFETQSCFNIGYDSEWVHPTAEKKIKSPRVIIPTSEKSYLARSIDSNISPKYKAIKAGKVHIFNEQALTLDDIVFIVEGEIDALSFEEIGYRGVALGSVSNVNLFLEAISKTKRENIKKPLVLCLDNDEAGGAAQKKIKAELLQRGILFIEGNECLNTYKDANDALFKDREAFIENVRKLYQQGLDIDVNGFRLEHCAMDVLIQLMQGIDSNAVTKAIPTGFKTLDSKDALDGGLYEGLYILGALSSLGKTTFSLQVADSVAKNGHDVIYFSLEMSKHEMLCKSISREYYLLAGGTATPKTTRDIITGSRWDRFSKDDKDNLLEAMNLYGERLKHLFIVEDVESTSQLAETVKQYMNNGINNPVVIVDYLQLLALCEQRGTDKQNVDKVVKELKGLSRACKVPVIAISSLNRGSYDKPITMESFKESGLIEYSADVLLGLQYSGVRREGFNLLKEMNETPRNIELVILKNRNGRTGGKISYEYYPAYNFFKES